MFALANVIIVLNFLCDLEQYIFSNTLQNLLDYLEEILVLSYRTAIELICLHDTFFANFSQLILPVEKLSKIEVLSKERLREID